MTVVYTCLSSPLNTWQPSYILSCLIHKPPNLTLSKRVAAVPRVLVATVALLYLVHDVLLVLPHALQLLCGVLGSRLEHIGHQLLLVVGVSLPAARLAQP